MDRATLIGRVQEKLPDKSPAEIEELVDRAIEHFCSETKRTRIPDRAGWLLVDIAIAFDNQSGSGSSGGMVIDAPVSSIKRGDTTIQYATGSSSDGASSSNALSGLESRINKFKVVRAV
ncbi:hypothetical protein LJC27_01860 [Christensenellaceae bacterium OttesenSCG-928-M15]|nr:hypothetical protein [Christensenellaceae bacterium OttesenSCG-928-M15]